MDCKYTVEVFSTSLGAPDHRVQGRLRLGIGTLARLPLIVPDILVVLLHLLILLFQLSECSGLRNGFSLNALAPNRDPSIADVFGVPALVDEVLISVDDTYARYDLVVIFVPISSFLRHLGLFTSLPRRRDRLRGVSPTK